MVDIRSTYLTFPGNKYSPIRPFVRPKELLDHSQITTPCYATRQPERYAIVERLMSKTGRKKRCITPLIPLHVLALKTKSIHLFFICPTLTKGKICTTLVWPLFMPYQISVWGYFINRR